MDMIRKHPILFRSLMLLAFPVFILLTLVYVYLKKGLPLENGELKVIGISSPVHISRDSRGVPTVVANNDDDALFALGFLHAQDRMWQLEYQRKVISGELSELVGRTAVPQDMWYRTLDIYARANSDWISLPKPVRQSLTAYTAGINAWIANSYTPPVEFLFLSIKPEPWREVDSLAILKHVAFNLSGNYWNEMSNQAVTGLLPEALLNTLLPEYPIEELLPVSLDVSSEAAQTASHIAREFLDVAPVPRRDGSYTGSNAWVVAGNINHGVSILANDPHLGMEMPSLWYAANIRGHELNVSGMTAVGLPLVLFGHNGAIAWGVTNMMADTQDLYFQQVNPLNPSEYGYLGNWEKFIYREEVINIRADFPAILSRAYKPVVLKVRDTANGPIINDINHVSTQPLALQWVGFDDGDTSYSAFRDVMYSQNWQSFRYALSQLFSPAVNMVYADIYGNIGHQGAGKIPIRNLGTGVIPAPAKSSAHIWLGYIPFEDMPSIYNPADGIFVNSNNEVESGGREHFISHEWASAARFNRITNLLMQRLKGSSTPLTADETWEIQQDELSVSAVALIPYLLELRGLEGLEQRAQESLTHWNGEMGRNSAAAAVFHIWMRHFRKFVFLDERLNSPIEVEAFEPFIGLVDEIDLVVLKNILENDPLSYCDDKGTMIAESCEDMLRISLTQATQELTGFLGPEVDNWAWGNIRKLELVHGIFRTGLSGDVFSRYVPGSGSPDTVNAGNAIYDKMEGYRQTTGPNFRQIITIHEKKIEWSVSLPTGQSGNILSRHYDDMLEGYSSQKLLPTIQVDPYPSDLVEFRLIPASDTKE